MSAFKVSVDYESLVSQNHIKTNHLKEEILIPHSLIHISGNIPSVAKRGHDSQEVDENDLRMARDFGISG